jgi:hypothetical protein
MYLVLLVIGALLALAGIVLAGLGVSAQGASFDPATMTPAIVAVIGGLVLFALGLALRVLKRIERAVAARAVELREPLLPEVSEDPAVAAIPTRVLPRPLAGRRASISEKRLDDALEKASEKMSEKLAAAERLETARTTAPEEQVALLAKAIGGDAPATASVTAEKDIVEVGVARAGRRIGTARSTPRFDLNSRSPLAVERAKEPGFDLWPRGPRPSRLNPQPSVPAAVEAMTIPETKVRESAETPSPALAMNEAAVPVTILKSGVVDGMAYTLFSDGSIEAELPQGRLRFGSITELRNHIEQSA